MRELTLDYEIFSEVDLSVCGVYPYVVHPSTEVMCMAVTDENAESYLWLPGMPILPVLQDAINSNDFKFYAFNAGFERLMWRHLSVAKHGWPAVPDRVWHCTAAQAAYQGLPRSLKKICARLGLGDDGKDLEGHKAMLETCKIVRGKRNTDPEKLQKVYIYCQRDTHAEHVIRKQCIPLPEIERALWYNDMKINQRGVPVDRALCEGAKYIIEDAFRIADETVTRATLTDEVDEETGNPISAATRPTQRDRILTWIREQGVVIPDYRESTLSEMLESHEKGIAPLPDNVRAVLKARQDTQSAAVAKYPKALKQISDDDRVRDQHVYYKAITGRYAARGLQLQNLRHPSPGFKITEDVLDAIRSGSIENVRKFGDPIDVLASCVRAIPRPKPGRVFVSADYAAIEARMLHWLVGDEPMLQKFRNNECIYSGMAAKIYGKDDAWARWVRDNYETNKEAKHYRTVGKVPSLGAGYCMGGGKLRMQAKEKFGLDLDLQMCDDIVVVYRADNPLIVDEWRQLYQAAWATVRTGKPICGRCWEFAMYRDYLTMKLPSGRRLFYHRPEIVDEGRYGRPELTYQGPNGRAYLSKSVLIENLDQAASRDIIAWGLLNCDRAGLNVITHVHDSITVECDELEAEAVAKQLSFCMTDLPPWAVGLPMKAESEIKYNFV